MKREKYLPSDFCTHEWIDGDGERDAPYQCLYNVAGWPTFLHTSIHNFMWKIASKMTARYANVFRFWGEGSFILNPNQELSLWLH